MGGEVATPVAALNTAEPSTRLTRLDLVTLVLAWVAAPAALVSTVAASLWDWGSGDFLVALVFGSAVLWVLDALVLVSTPAMAQRFLGRDSFVRRRWGRVPARYHAVLLIWVVWVGAAPLVQGIEGVLVWLGPTPGEPGTGEGLVSPAVAYALLAVGLAGRLWGPIALLVLRVVDGRRERAATEATPRADRPWRPEPRRTLLDRAALALVWMAPFAALAIGFTNQIGIPDDFLPFVAPFLLLVSLLLLAGAVHGVGVFFSVLRARSRVRDRSGATPVAYRVLAVTWAVAVVIPGVALPHLNGGCLGYECPWTPLSALEAILGRPVSLALTFWLVVLPPVIAIMLQIATHVLRIIHLRRDRPRAARSASFQDPATWYPPPVPQTTYYFPEARGVPEARNLDENRELR